ncbi:MAG: hypothetical protein WBM32_00055 [Crocosphaera sp.]
MNINFDDDESLKYYSNDRRKRMMIVKIDNYAFLVPYVNSSSELFLKTIIPSRKATKKYLGGISTND